MKKHTERGFTLVEFMVVISLIAILMVLALGNFNKSRLKTRDNVRVADIDTLRLVLEEYRIVCGVFPATLELSANNGRTGTCSSTLGDFIREIPTAPERGGNSLLIPGTVPSASVFNGYFYAGLSKSTNGPCYDYHIGAELEFSENNGENASSSLSEDHDFEDYENSFRCLGSEADFGSSNVGIDDQNGLYDFRSTNNH